MGEVFSFHFLVAFASFNLIPETSQGGLGWGGLASLGGSDRCSW